MKHTYITEVIIDNGDRVECDVCSELFLEGDTRTGGFLFGSYAYCPACAERSLPRIRSYNEVGHIKLWCPDGMTFREWCLRLRNGNNTVRITTVEKKEEP